jgi:hypothetical protein
VRNLLRLQGPRDHAVHLAALAQRGVREHPHQPDVPAAVDQPDAAAGQQPPQRIGRRREPGIATGA